MFSCQMYMYIGKQEIVFEKDMATLYVILKRCEDTKHF